LDDQLTYGSDRNEAVVVIRMNDPADRAVTEPNVRWIRGRGEVGIDRGRDGTFTGAVS
jgi:hypothetical protein